MSIVLGIVIFAVFYADMIWMNCIYPEINKSKKTPEEIESKSKFSSRICIIILGIVVAISYFAKLSQIVQFASFATFIMCIIKYLSFTKFIKKLKAEEDDYFNYYDYDEYRESGNIFEEYDDDYGEDEDSTFEQYDGKEEENYLELTDEDNIDDDEIVDIVNGKMYI